MLAGWANRGFTRDLEDAHWFERRQRLEDLDARVIVVLGFDVFVPFLVDFGGTTYKIPSTVVGLNLRMLLPGRRRRS